MSKYSFIKINIARILTVKFFLLAKCVSAKDPDTNVLNSSYSHHVIDYGQVIYGAVIVFVFLAVFIFVLKKLRLGKFGNENIVQVISSHPLSAKEKLQVIKVGQEYILIGISNSGINKIHQLRKDVIEKDIENRKNSNESFTNLFASTLNKFNHA